MIALLIIFSFCLAYVRWGGEKIFCVFFIYYLFDSGLSLTPAIYVKETLLYLFFFASLFQTRETEERFPFWPCIIVTICSVAISSMYTMNVSHWGMSIKSMISSVAMPYCFFRYVNSRQIVFLSRLFVLATFFLICYACMELIFNINPIRSFVVDQSGTDIEVTDKFRYGIKRVQTVFIHPTSCGYFFVTMFIFYILFFSEKFKEQANLSIILYPLTIVGCLVVTFLTGTRAAILPLVIFVLYLYIKRINIKNFVPLLVVSFVVFIVIMFVMSEYIMEIVNSIVNPNEEHFGSSGDMRERQFEIALLYWSTSPFIGLGPGMTFDEVTVLNEDMYGAESVWFPIMIDYGILGCFAYILYYIDAFRYMWKKRKEIVLFLFLLLMMNTATSVPGFEYTFILCMTLFAYRLTQFEQEEELCEQEESSFTNNTQIVN